MRRAASSFRAVTFVSFTSKGLLWRAPSVAWAPRGRFDEVNLLEVHSDGTMLIGNNTWRPCCTSRARAFAISVFTQLLFVLASDRINSSLS